MSLGRIYTVQFASVAVTAAQDLFEISPADDKPVKLHAVYLSQTTELGDAAEEQLLIQIIRGYTTSGSGGSAGTAVPLNPNDASAGFASEVNNTTVANTGTAVVLHTEAFNIRAGWMYLPTPEMRPVASQANTTIVVRLISTPADSITMHGCLYLEEV